MYSFGVVLMELVSGRKAVDISRPRDHQCLTEWVSCMLHLYLHRKRTITINHKHWIRPYDADEVLKITYLKLVTQLHLPSFHHRNVLFILLAHTLFKQARPLLDECAIDELVDPRLGNCYSEHEVCCMLYAASLCIRHEPHARPRMSQVILSWC